MAKDDDAIVLTLAGHDVKVSSPDKVFFPKAGATKLDLVRYYEAVAEPLMGTMQGRPLLMERYPNGATGKSFFQKRVPKGIPDWLRPRRPSRRRTAPPARRWWRPTSRTSCGA